MKTIASCANARNKKMRWLLNVVINARKMNNESEKFARANKREKIKQNKRRKKARKKRNKSHGASDQYWMRENPRKRKKKAKKCKHFNRTKKGNPTQNFPKKVQITKNNSNSSSFGKKNYAQLELWKNNSTKKPETPTDLNAKSVNNGSQAKSEKSKIQARQTQKQIR